MIKDADVAYYAVTVERRVQHRGVEAILDTESIVRVYIRHPSDLQRVRARVEKFLGGRSESVAYLHADICRRELQIEIDAAKFARPV